MLHINTFRTYLKMIENSTDSQLFKNFFVDENGKTKDVVENGNLSCAFFVSSILKIFDLIDRPHATVENSVKSMKQLGWHEIKDKQPNKGDVLVWEKIKFEDGTEHEHIGFFIGNKTAISNSDKRRVPIKHNFQFKGKRKITKILRWTF